QGVKVEGGLDRLGAVIKKTRAEAIVIAIVSLPKMSLKQLVQACKPFNLPIKIAKPIKDVDVEDTDIRALELQEIKIEELLGREEITVNQALLQGAVKGKRVLVTGGVGSIGSELCRQSLLAGCKHLIVLDMHENGMFEFCEEIKKKFKPKRFTPVVANVREEKRVAQIFEEYKPEIVFHAAAYKHVPVMEYSASEAIKNNVFGTLNMIEAAQKANTERFIFISTDKAVNPANIMGASKRIAEMLIQDIGRTSKMKIAAVRFGNVLGSNGSVIPIFLKQIKDGGPITITDRRIKRYFMSIPEAVRLVLQAGSLAEAGDVFVLDMGEPVLIYDLACDLIRLNGLVPEEDIKFKEIGLREGEKMFEELRYDKESAGVTSHEGIFVSHLEEINSNKFNAQIAKLKKFAFNEDIKKTTEVIFEMVPSSFRGMKKEEQMATSEYVEQGVRKSEQVNENGVPDCPQENNIAKAGEA
ncbi:MAG: polysaccharide biosynthesis protein, partial [Firmicutes bacterium]|nr:polysaccharide biosynthesis protein [Bacillota bacterium]